MWLNENVLVEVFKYKGESEIHIRNSDEGVMLTKTPWENRKKYAKMLGFDQYFGV